MTALIKALGWSLRGNDSGSRRSRRQTYPPWMTRRRWIRAGRCPRSTPHAELVVVARSASPRRSIRSGCGSPVKRFRSSATAGSCTSTTAASSSRRMLVGITRQLTRQCSTSHPRVEGSPTAADCVGGVGDPQSRHIRQRVFRRHELPSRLRVQAPPSPSRRRRRSRRGLDRRAADPQPSDPPRPHPRTRRTRQPRRPTPPNQRRLNPRPTVGQLPDPPSRASTGP